MFIRRSAYQKHGYFTYLPMLIVVCNSCQIRHLISCHRALESIAEGLFVKLWVAFKRIFSFQISFCTVCFLVCTPVGICCFATVSNGKENIVEAVFFNDLSGEGICEGTEN